MSGTQCILFAAGLPPGTGVIGISANAVNTGITMALRGVTFSLANNGTYTLTNSAGGNWYNPTTTSIGSSWSVKATIGTSNLTTTGGTFGSWLSLSAGQNFSFTNDATSHEGTGNFTLAFSPDGGTTTAVTTSCTWDVGYAP